MRLKWLGTATILVETGKQRLIFDPYLRELNTDRTPFPVDELKELDGIFITHPHLDHFADIQKVMDINQTPKAPVYVCGRGIEIATKQGFLVDRMIRIKPGDQFIFGKLNVTVFQGLHCVFDSSIVKETLWRSLSPKNFQKAMEIERLNKEFHIEKQDIYCYFLEEDGKKIFLMGSANMPQIEQAETQSDLLVFPYQGRSDMETYSLEFIRLLQPKRVLLDHYDDAFPPVSKQMQVKSFIQLAKDNFPDIPVIETIENEWYEV